MALIVGKRKLKFDKFVLVCGVGDQAIYTAVLLCGDREGFRCGVMRDFASDVCRMNFCEMWLWFMISCLTIIIIIFITMFSIGRLLV